MNKSVSVEMRQLCRFKKDRILFKHDWIRRQKSGCGRVGEFSTVRCITGRAWKFWTVSWFQQTGNNNSSKSPLSRAWQRQSSMTVNFYVNVFLFFLSPRQLGFYKSSFCYFFSFCVVNIAWKNKEFVSRLFEGEEEGRLWKSKVI